MRCEEWRAYLETELLFSKKLKKVIYAVVRDHKVIVFRDPLKAWKFSSTHKEWNYIEFIDGKHLLTGKEVLIK